MDLQHQLLREDDMSNILWCLKEYVESASSKNMTATSGCKPGRKIDWRDIFVRARQVNLPSAPMFDILSKFDPEHNMFKM
jgi:hypothetical protein